MFDDTSSESGTTISYLEWTHTVGTGDNRILMVGISLQDDPYPIGSVTGITYGTYNMTFVDTATQSSDDSRVEIWKLVAPPIGTNTIVVTFSEPVYWAVGGATSWTSVNPDIPLGTFVYNFGSTDEASVNVISGVK